MDINAYIAQATRRAIAQAEQTADSGPNVAIGNIISGNLVQVGGRNLTTSDTDDDHQDDGDVQVTRTRTGGTRITGDGINVNIAGNADGIRVARRIIN